MSLRRKFLTQMGIAGLAIPTLALGNKKPSYAKYRTDGSQTIVRVRNGKILPPPTQARGGNYFPNHVMYSHTGETFRLFDDLIDNKVVMVNFMSIAGHQQFQVTKYLAAIADRLGKQLGRDVFMCSISTDPLHDTPKKLKAHAEQYGADRAGWHFLTTSKNNVSAISKRLFSHGRHANNHPIRIVHYGNGGVGVWGAFGADSNPEFVVERLSWLKNGRGNNGTTPVVAGPARLTTSTRRHHNRVS
ncbi:MAG TPA: hypothetical protein ENJ32_05070 [Crenotrichaceae bacterium]|nr:hypothetical protein [Crenotrichaceae bacterium]